MTITLDQLPLADLLQWFQQQSDSSQFLDTQTATAQIDDATITNSTVDTTTITNLTATNATITNLNATTVDLTNTTLHNASATGTSGRTATIIDNSGNSSFLQLVGATTLQCAFGTASFTGTGTSAVSTVVAHGIGRTPVIVLMTPALSGLGLAWGADIYLAASSTTSGFVAGATASGSSTFNSGTAFYFEWLAIG